MCVDVPTYAEEDYAISEERLRAAITPRTKAIIFNNPTNPTGMGYDLSTMEMLARVAKCSATRFLRNRDRIVEKNSPILRSISEARSLASTALPTRGAAPRKEGGLF